MPLNDIHTECFAKGQDEIIGNVEFHHEFYSRHLKNERDIIVWLPPSYNSSVKKFPVLYMHDGQNLFSPQTSFLGYDWKVDEVMSVLLKNKKIQEIIVVGIYNSKNRLAEYNLFSEEGRAYSLFMIKELKPFIDDTYRTKSDCNNTAIMGSSLGGLISFQMVWKYPNVFGKAACMSNSFWVNNREIFEFVVKEKDRVPDVKIYLDCGSSEKELIRDNKKMCLILRSLGFVQGKNLLCNFVRGGKHSEFDWAKRLHCPLTFLFGKNKETNSYAKGRRLTH